MAEGNRRAGRSHPTGAGSLHPVHAGGREARQDQRGGDPGTLSGAARTERDLAGAAAASFLEVAPVEEGVKIAVVLLVAWRRPAFNEENDGIVYMGAAAIGFSLLENIFYVLPGGFGTGIARALTSIPLHTFTGVLMGYFVGLAKFSPTFRARRLNIAAGFILVCLIHAVYDTLALSNSVGVGLLIIPLVIALIIFGVIYMKKGARLSEKRWGRTAAGNARRKAPCTS